MTLHAMHLYITQILVQVVTKFIIFPFDFLPQFPDFSFWPGRKEFKVFKIYVLQL